MQTLETIYKRTRTGAVQIWYAQIEGGKFRTVSGQQGGKHTVSEWTITYPKNVGRSNETTAEQQAHLEVTAMYNKRLEREYRRDISKIDVKHYTKPAKCLKWYEDAKKRPKKGTKIGVQPKFDGMRCLTSENGSKSQDGIIIPGAPHIIEALDTVFQEVTLEENGQEVMIELDGELYNHEFKEDFEGLMSALKKVPETEERKQYVKQVVKYHIYDIHLPNTDYYVGDGTGRYEILQALHAEYLSKFGDMFQISPMHIVEMDDDGKVVEDIDDDYIELGYEGSVVRILKDDGYSPGSRKTMFKVKNFQDDEFPILKIMEGKGNWSGHAKAILVRLPNGNKCKASVKGNKTYAKELWENREKYEDGKAMATVSFLRYSKKGMLNLPIFKSVRFDV